MRQDYPVPIEMEVIEHGDERYMKVGEAKARRFLQLWGEIGEMPVALS